MGRKKYVPFDPDGIHASSPQPEGHVAAPGSHLRAVNSNDLPKSQSSSGSSATNQKSQSSSSQLSSLNLNDLSNKNNSNVTDDQIRSLLKKHTQVEVYKKWPKDIKFGEWTARVGAIADQVAKRNKKNDAMVQAHTFVNKMTFPKDGIDIMEPAYRSALSWLQGNQSKPVNFVEGGSIRSLNIDHKYKYTGSRETFKEAACGKSCNGELYYLEHYGQTSIYIAYKMEFKGEQLRAVSSSVV